MVSYGTGTKQKNYFLTTYHSSFIVPQNRFHLSGSITNMGTSDQRKGVNSEDKKWVTNTIYCPKCDHFSSFFFPFFWVLGQAKRSITPQKLN
jgi:hypothetical protein